MKLRSMTVTAAMSKQCEFKDSMVRRRKSVTKVNTSLNSGSESSIVSTNSKESEQLMGPDSSSSKQQNLTKEIECGGAASSDNVKKSKVKKNKEMQDDIFVVRMSCTKPMGDEKKDDGPRVPNTPSTAVLEKSICSEKTTPLRDSSEMPEIIIDDDSSPLPCVGQATGSRLGKRKSMNDSIVILGEVNRQTPPPKKRRTAAQHKESSCETVINLCDDDIPVVEINSPVTDDIIYLDPNQKTPSLPLRAKKRDRTCTVVNNTGKYESFLTMLEPTASAVADNTVSSTSSGSSFAVDTYGWKHLKRQLTHNKHHRRHQGRNHADRRAGNPPLATQPMDGSNPIGSNIYNPNPQEPKPSGALRPVIIDGSNVAMAHSGGARIFSCRGLQICVNYFTQRGHEVKAFVPKFRKSDYHVPDAHILDELERSGHVVYTPSRRVEGKLCVPYDDRYIVQYAASVGGVIVSTDNYRDLLKENEAWRETIEKRLLMFTWVGDVLMFPVDPLGRHGPQLDDFLRFPR